MRYQGSYFIVRLRLEGAQRQLAMLGLVNGQGIRQEEEEGSPQHDRWTEEAVSPGWSGGDEGN